MHSLSIEKASADEPWMVMLTVSPDWLIPTKLSLIFTAFVVKSLTV